jgi:septal ring factor EnvC (AmiA/AmiB activator)
MSKKPLPPKKPASKVQPPVASHPPPLDYHNNDDLARIKQLEAEIAELHRQLGEKLAEIAHLNEIIEPLEQDVQKHAGLANAAAELAALKQTIEPFVKCAKGEGTTSPEDWDKLKGIA